MADDEQVSIGAYERSFLVARYEDPDITRSRISNPYIVELSLGSNFAHNKTKFWLNVEQTEDLITVLQYQLMQHRLEH